MSDANDQPVPEAPTGKQLRDARRQAHAAQKSSGSAHGGDKKGKKGKMGKGDRKP